MILFPKEPPDRARDLEREYDCEHCHAAPATEMFDRQFVCSPCRKELEKELAHG